MPRVLLLADFSEEYFKRILLGVAKFSKEHGPWEFCRMPIYYRETLGVEGILKWAVEWQTSGMLVQMNNDADAEKLKNAGFPVIAQDFMERFSDLPNITGDYYETGKMGADYFLKRGFVNFAYYGFTSFVWSRERGEGFKEYLKERGFDVSFFIGDNLYRPEFWYYKPSALSDWIKGLPKPVAIMACDDNRGQHLTEACKLAGIKIPEEVAVLGVDNDELVCTLSDPPLSSIALNAERAGYEAAKLLNQLMTYPGSIGHDVIVSPIQVITRQSTDIYATPDKEIAKALKYIHQNINTTLMVNTILGEVPLSRRSFEIRFKKVAGVSVHQYILKLKIGRIAKLLVETDKTVNEIAQETGFTDVKNIARLFKQTKGCSPISYRKMHKATST